MKGAKQKNTIQRATSQAWGQHRTALKMRLARKGLACA